VFDTGHGPVLVEDLKLPETVATEISEELTRDAGLILVCGPTGSGKTTTLYALLRSCGSSFRNIITIEDPVEVQIEGTTQLPVDEANGKGFAALLRSVLRQDPDVIMVGEIRDSETAKIALQAAMTGHLVLSTIHTRDTAGTIFRLLDLGIEPYMVSQGLHLVLAQRLVRTLCAACKRAIPATDEDRARMGVVGSQVKRLYAPVGCPNCLGTGFYNRRAFFEFMSTGDDLREAVMKTPSIADIQRTQGAGFTTLLEQGYHLVAEGLTSLDEVERAVGR
jgi:general secretion pathway protein E